MRLQQALLLMILQCQVVLSVVLQRFHQRFTPRPSRLLELVRQLLMLLEINSRIGWNNNSAATQFTWTYDNVVPTMAITSTTSGVTSGSTTNDSTIALRFTSSRATSDFVVGDITVSGGSLSSFYSSFIDSLYGDLHTFWRWCYDHRCCRKQIHRLSWW